MTTINSHKTLTIGNFELMWSNGSLWRRDEWIFTRPWKDNGCWIAEFLCVIVMWHTTACTKQVMLTEIGQ